MLLTRPWLTAALLLPGALGAQQRITLRGAPAPNQTIRITMVQDLAFDVALEGIGMGPMRIEGKIGFSALQRVGKPDAFGRVTAELTLDSVTFVMTANGTPTTFPASLDELKGKTLSLSYDATAKLVDVKADPMLRDAAANAKHIVMGVSGIIPNVALAIGDSVTVPVSIPLPIPGLVGAPGQTTSLETRVTSKLVAIRRDGPDRIAVLEQRHVSEGSQPMEFTSPNGPVSGTMEMHMTGSGTMELNADKGYVKAAASDMKMDMTLVMAAMAIKLTGTTRVVVTGSAVP
jgi:hypothetical protein